MPQRAFTLLEMLLTVAVIGILSALIIPAVNGVRDRAAQAKCIGNLKTLTAGIMNFAGDNNGDLPQEYNNTPPTGGPGRNRWNLQIAPYMGYEAMQSASGTAADSARRFPAMFCPACSASWRGKGWWESDYAPNGRMITNAGTAQSPLRLNSIIAPSRKILLVENASLRNPLNSGSGEVAVTNLLLTGGYTPPGTVEATVQRDLGFRHPPTRRGSLSRAECNVAFADGRVESLKPGDPRLSTLDNRRLLFDPTVTP